MAGPLALLGLGAGLVNTVGKWFGGGKQKREAGKIKPVFNQYTTSPFAKKRLGLAENVFNARMPGASTLEKNIQTAGANFNAGIDRSATDASQALALKAAGLGSTNESLENLQLQESQSKYGLLNNLNSAYAAMIGEGDKEYDSMFQKFQMDTQQKQSLLNAGMANKFGAGNDLASLLLYADQLGIGGKKGSAKGGTSLGGLGSGLSMSNWILPGQTPGSRMKLTP